MNDIFPFPNPDRRSDERLDEWSDEWDREPDRLAAALADALEAAEGEPTTPGEDRKDRVSEPADTADLAEMIALGAQLRQTAAPPASPQFAAELAASPGAIEARFRRRAAAMAALGQSIELLVQDVPLQSVGLRTEGDANPGHSRAVDHVGYAAPAARRFRLLPALGTDAHPDRSRQRRWLVAASWLLAFGLGAVGVLAAGRWLLGAAGDGGIGAQPNRSPALGLPDRGQGAAPAGIDHSMDGGGARASATRVARMSGSLAAAQGDASPSAVTAEPTRRPSVVIPGRVPETRPAQPIAAPQAPMDGSPQPGITAQAPVDPTSDGQPSRPDPSTTPEPERAPISTPADSPPVPAPTAGPPTPHPDGVSITGRVWIEDGGAGQPLEGVVVRLVPAAAVDCASGASAAAWRSVETDRTGNYGFDGLPAGAYYLGAADGPRCAPLRWHNGARDVGTVRPCDGLAIILVVGQRVDSANVLYAAGTSMTCGP